jgi:DNA invertase Pin-like site-specific DNA recombinase
MSSKNQSSSVVRTVALCYIRQSVTKHANDMQSPDRQRAVIQAYCEKHGWTPEWYQDAEGHKSGRYEDNREQWLALKNRLTDSDIAALVVYDQSRVMRST